MKAAIIVEQQGRRGIAVADIPEPVPGPGEVRVRVRAGALNRADLALNPNHRQTAAAQAVPVAGMEFAGEIEALGPHVRRWQVGDRVMGMSAGAFAEACLCDARLLLPAPEGVPFTEAATLPVALQTMHDAIVTNGRLAAGETVLVHGAASGVGMAGIQIAKLMGAGRVIGSSRSDARLAALRAFGMDDGIELSGDWVGGLERLAGAAGIPLAIDMVAGTTVNGLMRAAAVRGRIVNVGRLAGMHGEFDFDLHAKKRIDYIGVTFRTRSTEEIETLIARMNEDLWEHVDAGRIRVPVDRVFTLDDVVAAFAYMRSNAHLGKVVLQI
ncbi:MAG: zinc-binding dehydrogenase [Burkholderiales bacterium]|nr:MAG: zinc-binding dehydrogenase [Burkholderiales bacterium]